MAVLKENVDFIKPVDLSGRRSTPQKCYRIFFVRGHTRGGNSIVLRGVRGRGDPAGVKRRGGSPARPRKSVVPRDRERRPVNIIGNPLGIQIGSSRFNNYLTKASSGVSFILKL